MPPPPIPYSPHPSQAYAKLHTVQVNSGQKLDASHKEQLRSLFESLDQGTFEHVYSLFNWELGVDAKEFVLTMSLLAVPTKVRARSSARRE